jgi:flagellar basal-body rod protein FlgB
MASLFSTRTDTVTKGALDGLAARHRVYAHNLANLETPGFQPAEVPFEVQLRQIRDSMASNPTRDASARRLLLTPVPDDQGAQRADGNDVLVDEQVMRLAENSLRYDALAHSTRMRNDLLRSVISEGRK